jgi:hypothetical protein
MINPSYGAVFSTQRLAQLRQHGGDGSVSFPTPVAHMVFAVRRVQEVMGMPVTVNVARDDGYFSAWIGGRFDLSGLVKVDGAGAIRRFWDHTLYSPMRRS